MVQQHVIGGIGEELRDIPTFFEVVQYIQIFKYFY